MGQPQIGMQATTAGSVTNYQQGMLLSQQQQQSQTSAKNIVQRTLCVHITGSLANLTLAGPQAAMWKPVPGTETAVFCPALEGDMDPAEMTNAIRNGIVRSVKIMEQRSTFPCTMGVSMNCVRPTEVTDLGDQYAYTVLPHSSITSPQTVFACDTSLQENSVWMQQYGKWNKSNLGSEGVIDVPNQSYVFVHMDHPAIGLLRHNADLIGCDIDNQYKLDGQYVRVSRQVLGECFHTLRTKVMKGMDMAEDMNMFSVQLHRLNAETWDDLGDGTVALEGFKTKAKWTPEEHEREKEHHLRQFVTTPYQYIARLQVEYEIPSTALA